MLYIYFSFDLGDFSRYFSYVEFIADNAVTCRQEIIKRYPGWRKYYRHISKTLRVVDDGGERERDKRERTVPITVHHTSSRVGGGT